jgi:hypothetical protein
LEPVRPGFTATGTNLRHDRQELSFPRFFTFQPDGIMPPIRFHADF